MRARTRVALLSAVACLGCLMALAAAGPAAAAFGDRALREGMSGSDVQTLQRKLTKLGLETAVDGFYGPNTKRSMRRWERRGDYRVNGRCSRRDARRIKRQVRRLRDADTEAGGDEEAARSEPAAGSGGDYGPQHEYASRRLERGDRGTDVARLQRLLTRQGLPTSVDGTFGASTRVNVEKWEAWRYRRADGVVRRRQARKILRLARRGVQYEARRHAFPIRGPHDYGGSGSRFGAPRSGHTHQGQDMSAAHGTPLVAVHSGKVAYRQYQAGGAGHYVVIQGRDGSDSVYMHMPRRAIVAPGEYVRAGERIGSVGTTGASTGPHLHFELWTEHWYAGGSAYDPLQKLQRWGSRT